MPWIGAVGLGLFMVSILPTIMMLAGERMQVTGAITDWFLAGSGIGVGGMPLPWAIGQAFILVGAQAMPVLVLSAFVVNLLVLSLFAIFARSRTFIT